LNKNYKIFQTLREQSGFGWDSEEQLPTAPDDVWDAYIEVHLSSNIVGLTKYSGILKRTNTSQKRYCITSSYMKFMATIYQLGNLHNQL